MKHAIVVALPCLVLAAQHAPAQTAAPRSSAPTTTLSSRSNLVLVPALVRNRTGEPVFTLKAGDFLLTDDGVPQKLTLEEDSGSEPLALVVLIQAGAASKSAAWHPKLRGSKKTDSFVTVPTLVESMVGKVPHTIAVVGFDSGPELLRDFTTNMDAAADAIYQLDSEIDGDGGAAILDALTFSLDLLRRQPPEYRRAILLLSQAHDHGSHTKLEDALRAVSDTNTAIYSFSFGSDDDLGDMPTKRVTQQDGALVTLENVHPGPAHGCMSRDPHDPEVKLSKSVATQLNNCVGLLLPPVAIAEAAYIAAADGIKKNIPETVARLTGGEYFKPGSEQALERDLQSLTNHIPNRYMLSFQPQSPRPGLHVLKLRTPSYAGFEIIARPSYWADTPATAATQP